MKIIKIIIMIFLFQNQIKFYTQNIHNNQPFFNTLSLPACFIKRSLSNPVIRFWTL